MAIEKGLCPKCERESAREGAIGARIVRSSSDYSFDLDKISNGAKRGAELGKYVPVVGTVVGGVLGGLWGAVSKKEPEPIKCLCVGCGQIYYEMPE